MLYIEHPMNRSEIGIRKDITKGKKVGKPLTPHSNFGKVHGVARAARNLNVINNVEALIHL